MKLSDLKPADYNPRDVEDEAIDGLKVSIEEFGDLSGITFNRRTGNLVCGHQRVRSLEEQYGDMEVTAAEMGEGAAIVEGAITTPAGERFGVRFVDWPLEKEKLANVAANNPEIQGRFNDKLPGVLAPLKTDGLFKPLRLDVLEKSLPKLKDPDDGKEDSPAPDPWEGYVPVTQRGEILELGDHRVLCGDSTSEDDVERLMENEVSDILFTSPPYALGDSASLSGNRSMAKRGSAYMEKENKNEWPSLMDGWWKACEPYSKSFLVNVQPLAGNKRECLKWINDRRSRLVDIVTWDKGRAAPPMARSVLSSQYEWIIIFGNESASRSIPFSSWRGTVSSVFSSPPQSNNEFSNVHGATMPVAVPDWILGVLCDESDSVLDPFLGSGTTLIACENLGRRCYGIEISPRYCDVIVVRWLKHVGPENHPDLAARYSELLTGDPSKEPAQSAQSTQEEVDPPLASIDERRAKDEEEETWKFRDIPHEVLRAGPIPEQPIQYQPILAPRSWRNLWGLLDRRIKCR